MKTEFWVQGKLNHTFLNQGIDFYLKRIKLYIPFELCELRDIKATHPEEIKIREEMEILKKLKGDEKLILLDEKGKSFTSAAFASYLQGLFNSTNGKLIFLSGGAYGFGDQIYHKSNDQISLSAMTFTHDMVRLIFLEQMYRALTIINNHPYQH